MIDKIKNIFKEYRVDSIFNNGKYQYYIVWKYIWQDDWKYLDGEKYSDYEEAFKYLTKVEI